MEVNKIIYRVSVSICHIKLPIDAIGTDPQLVTNLEMI